MPDPFGRGEGEPSAEPSEAEARLLRGVRWRLVAWSGGTTLLVLIVLSVALYVAVANTLTGTGIRVLDDRAEQLVSFLHRGPGRGPEPPTEFIFGGGTSGTFAFLVDEEGSVFGPNVTVPDVLPDRSSIAAARASGRDVRQLSAAGVPVRVMSQSVVGQNGTAVIQIVQDRSSEQGTLDVLVTVLVLGGVVVLLVSLGVGAAYAQRALVPIRQSLVVQRQALRRQREFAADASHELRTPLTVIRSSVEHLRRNRDMRVTEVGSALDDIDAEASQLTTLVEDLLLLARSDSGAMEMARQPLDLGDVAADAGTLMTTPATARDVTVMVDPEPAMVIGDSLRLRQVVTILLDNAIRHSPRGGTVTARVRAVNGQASLVVEDEGPGIRPEDLPRVFDRFYRAAGAPSGGTGLGLAIAGWIVTHHGGRIGVANRVEGGARFTVEMPAHVRAVPPFALDS
ncbi:MAG: HAMP domain-containing sensor histidine kinase [Candidatus Limnocylindrales bacterium]